MSFPNNGNVGQQQQQQGYGGKANWGQGNILAPPQQQQYAVPGVSSNNSGFQQQQQLAPVYSQDPRNMVGAQVANYQQSVHQQSLHGGYGAQLLLQQQPQQQQQLMYQNQILQQPHAATAPYQQQPQMQPPPPQIHQQQIQQNLQLQSQLPQQQQQMHYGANHTVGMAPPPPPPPMDPRRANPPPPIPPPPSISAPIQQSQYPMSNAVPPPPVVPNVPPPSMNNLPPPPPPPSKFICQLCNITCQTEFSFQQHLNGASHRKRKELTKEQNNPLFCKICKVTCPNEFSLKQHLIGEKHKKRLMTLKAPPTAKPISTVFQFRCIMCNVKCINETSLLNHLSGVRHKKTVGDGGGASAIQCNACNVSCTSEFNLLQHLSSDSHKSRVRDLSSGKTSTGETCVAVPGQSKPRPPPQQQQQQQWYCDACRVGCPSEESYKQHINGKRHKKKVAKREEELIKQRGQTEIIQSLPSAVPSNVGSGMGLQSSSNSAAAALSTSPSNPVKLETKVDSDEEGLIDEKSPDVDHLYGTAPAANQVKKEEAASALDVQEGSDDEIDMFGDDDSDGAGKSEQKKEEDDDDDDEADMFDNSDEETGEDEKAAIAPLKSEATTLDSGLAFALDYSPHTNTTQEQKEDKATSDVVSSQKTALELGIIFLKDPNIPNGEVFPSQLKFERKGKGKDKFAPLCADFVCVGKQCTKPKGKCNFVHVNSYRIIGQEKFDLICQHLLSKKIGWVSEKMLRKKNCGVILRPEYKDLLGDANGCAIDFSADNVPNKSKAKAKSAGISWADTGDSKGGKPASLEQGATVRTASGLVSATRSVLKKPRYSSNVDSKAYLNITRPSSLERTYYQNVHPDKFWAEMRNWDFLSELNTAMKSSKNDPSLQKGTKRTHDEISGADKAKACLPDVFESSVQYKALWAPLLIEEAKAQIMSEVVAAQSSPNTRWIHNGQIAKGTLVNAEISTSARSSSDYEFESSPMEPTVVVRLKRGANMGSQVYPNDLLLFSPNSSSVELALRGIAFDAESVSSGSHLTHMKKGRFGFIGRALNHRSGSVDGLLVRVSQKLWTQFSSLNELFVIKIGSNITAVREFNALMRIEKLPLNEYLLQGKGNVDQDNQQLKSKALEELPIGFQAYLKSKANSSQLDAISAAAREYGKGGFTLVQGPPGTGKSTTLVSTLNALHLRQYQEYYTTIERISTEEDTTEDYELLASLNKAAKVKPRVLVCAPSNAAIDNVIVKIMSERFVDGKGFKYSPSIVRVGAGSTNPTVISVGIKNVVNRIIEEGSDVNKLEEIISKGRRELGRLQKEIQKLRARIRAIVDASPYAISSDWEIRIDEENFERTGRVFFVNHRHKTTTFDVPPKNRPIETPAIIERMPHYRKLLDSLTKFVEKHNNDSSALEKYIILQNIANAKAAGGATHFDQLENHVLNSSHIVLTTLGSAGSKIIEEARKFAVVVIDEAAQSSELSTLTALQFGSSHAVLVGDTHQLPATIFSVSGRSTKFDRSLFQRLEEAGHKVHMLNTQYRMHPVISAFPRHIFYGGMLLDGPNVRSPRFGGDLKDIITMKFPKFQQFNFLDLDSMEERDGTSLCNRDEAELVLHLYRSIDQESEGIVARTQVAIITPYSQQVSLLRRMFGDAYGASYEKRVEISTVDAFQGRESSVVIFSCVRAGDKSSGIGFLSDVQRMNVALTRAMNYLFVVSRRKTINTNPYWRDLVNYAREQNAIIQVPINRQRGCNLFPNLVNL